MEGGGGQCKVVEGKVRWWEARYGGGRQGKVVGSSGRQGEVVEGKVRWWKAR